MSEYVSVCFVGVVLNKYRSDDFGFENVKESTR